MTFDSAAWAINGPEISAALARRAAYATSRQSGVVQKEDLKVTQLGTPGVGVLIESGVGLILNDYQTSPNEVYVTNNPGTHTIPSGEMPASNPSAKSYIVAIVVGDPDFSQTGHPWMGPSDPPAGKETTFQYVRPTLIEVSAGATDVTGAFPALSLARIDIPANTTTITDAMITDLRVMANPRSERKLAILAPPRTTLTSASYVRFPDAAYGVKIPAWATKAQVVVHLAQMVYFGPEGTGSLRARIGSIAGPEIGYDFDTLAGSADRSSMVVAANMDIPLAMRGTTQDVYVEGKRNSGTGYMDSWDVTSDEVIEITFSEE